MESACYHQLRCYSKLALVNSSFWRSANNIFARAYRLRESDRYPKANTPFRCDWGILVIDNPLPGNIKGERWQTGTNDHSSDSQAQR